MNNFTKEDLFILDAILDKHYSGYRSPLREKIKAMIDSYRDVLRRSVIELPITPVMAVQLGIPPC